MNFDEDLDFGHGAEFTFKSEDTGGSEGTSIASIDTEARPPRLCYPCARRPKYHLIFRSLKTSCWYVNYLKPGAVWDLTYVRIRPVWRISPLVSHASLQGRSVDRHFDDEWMYYRAKIPLSP
jgi:hypothetical protein